MRVIGLLSILLLAGCAGQASVDHWQGAHMDDLLRAYGVPDKTAHTSNGLKLVQYSQSKVIGVGDIVSTHHCTARFYLDDSDTVVAGDIEGSRGECRRLSKVEL